MSDDANTPDSRTPAPGLGLLGVAPTKGETQRSRRSKLAERLAPPRAHHLVLDDLYRIIREAAAIFGAEGAAKLAKQIAMGQPKAGRPKGTTANSRDPELLQRVREAMGPPGSIPFATAARIVADREGIGRRHADTARYDVSAFIKRMERLNDKQNEEAERALKAETYFASLLAAVPKKGPSRLLWREETEGTEGLLSARHK